MSARIAKMSVFLAVSNVETICGEKVSGGLHVPFSIKILVTAISYHNKCYVDF